MIVEIDLKTRGIRVFTVLVVLAACSFLAVMITTHFVVGTLTDERAEVSRGDLTAAVYRFPHSARLRARLAQADLMQPGGDIETAFLHVRVATDKVPDDFSLWLLRASIEESRGERNSALESLRKASRLAPANTDVHWRLANLLLRTGRSAEAIAEFKRANDTENELLPASFDLIWQASGGNPLAVEGLVGADFRRGISLAQFLLGQGRVEEAGAVFKRLDRPKRLAGPEGGAFIGSLITTGQIEMARNLWIDSVAEGDTQPAIVWNGSFEQPISKNLAQFDWNLGRSEFARIAVDSNAGRSGSRSLRIDFAGRDTTRLDSEIKQLVLLDAGRRYRLECFVKTEGFTSPEGPRIAVTGAKDATWSVSSDAVASGSSDWLPYIIEFVAPPSAAASKAAVQVSIKRKPRFSYDDPTKGIVWFDDFSISPL